MNQPAQNPVGILLVDKPADARTSSARVVAAVKRRLIAAGAPKRIKVGHAGTLDPLASGLLVILIGRGATRLCAELMSGEKEYEARVDLSHASATDDYEGPLESHPPPASEPMRADVDRVLAGLVGTIMQRPPAFSAMKVGGKRAYAEARRGNMVELAARPVIVRSIDVLEYQYPMIDVRIRCGKGTYIRSMARDIGLALTGRAACLAALRRTAVGAHRVETAVRLDALPDQLIQPDLLPVPALSAPADQTPT
ncbi:MAG: tRNA pseudouridine(55) synthase TruB [Phycisphaeraceae bacterium]|nr:tRNA pseudouridine(55) synthase TruB [Phycisphaeraceae bacterium]MBX3406103.1 tRNA pseudouridine(55) synthase TruB [Phycisphaeraceae bacterium]